MKFGCNRPSSFRGEVVWNCGRTTDRRTDGRTTDGRRTTEPSHPISSPGAFGSGELTNIIYRLYSFSSGNMVKKEIWDRTEQNYYESPTYSPSTTFPSLSTLHALMMSFPVPYNSKQCGFLSFSTVSLTWIFSNGIIPFGSLSWKKTFKMIIMHCSPWIVQNWPKCSYEALEAVSSQFPFLNFCKLYFTFLF